MTSRGSLFFVLCPLSFVLGGVCAMPARAQAPSPILIEQRQRELVMVRHLRQHAIDPSDGLALSADRRDLQRLRSSVPPAAPPPLAATATDDELVDSLGALVDVWYLRLVERQPFGTMPRERIAVLQRVQEAVGRLQSRGRAGGLEVWLPDVTVEVNALLQATSGQGALQDASIDMALRLADAAAAGRPMLSPGPYPPLVTGPGAPPPVPLPGSAPGAYPAPVPPGGPGSSPSGPLPPPPGSSTPYSLPPVYQDYGQPAASSGGYAACQTLRVSAGVAQSASDMLRAAECWTRTPIWPGWGEQAFEALDWALGLAMAERKCEALSAAITSVREIGPRLAGSGMTDAVLSLARRGEADRRRLQGQSLCR
jgi:hypothetical protein